MQLALYFMAKLLCNKRDRTTRVRSISVTFEIRLLSLIDLFFRLNETFFYLFLYTFWSFGFSCFLCSFLCKSSPKREEICESLIESSSPIQEEWETESNNKKMIKLSFESSEVLLATDDFTKLATDLFSIGQKKGWSLQALLLVYLACRSRLVS